MSGAARAAPTDDLASRFVTAPDTAPDQRRLVQIEMNGVDFGLQLIELSGHGAITLPPETVRALHLVSGSQQALELSRESGVVAHYDEPQATLALAVPTSLLAAQHFAPEMDAGQFRLSPETWGVYANYDVNLRHDLGSSAAAAGGGKLGSWGGLADVRALGPDVAGSFGWAYDDAGSGSNGLARLDSTLTWRPAWLGLAVSAGDVVSSTTAAVAQARPYRFGGLQIGTDHSGTPGWSSSSIPSVIGTAQAQSAIDVYLDGQRTYHADTVGGPFSLVLPAGSSGAGTSVVVTDVTGRSVVVPVDVPMAEAQLLRRGTLLWSAGAGVPRFGYGSSRASYDGQPYGYANARYGAWDRVTAAAHAEVGSGLAEAEAGADAAVTPWLAAHGAVSASRSARGHGGAGRLSLNVVGPWGFGLETGAARTIGRFDDVVSVSGRSYDRMAGINPQFSVPAVSELSARASWQGSARFSLSASYQANTYEGSSSVGFASLAATYLWAGRIPVIATLSHATGRQQSTTILAGVSLTWGAVQASASGGYGTGGGAQGALGDRGGPTGSVAIARPLGETAGDIGWNAYATRAPTGTFASADAQVRTGYGVPGLGVQSFGRQATGYVTLRGSAGGVGLHPFVSDPAGGGIIIADVGRSGVPVQLNGYDKGRTSFDGKIALPDAVPGSPQRVAIDTSRMPIDAVPSETDQLVVVRDQGAAVASFGVRSSSASALLKIIYHGHPPPVGSTVSSSTSSAPVSKEGRVYLPSIGKGEVLTVELPDGGKCLVRTDFDGKGGVDRKLGTLSCEDAN